MSPNVTKSLYVAVTAVLLAGILFQIGRSQFVLKTLHNNELLSMKDLLLHENIQQSEENGAKSPIYCIAYNPDDLPSVAIKDNSLKTLHYMKKQTKEIRLDGTNDQFRDCHSVLFTADSMGFGGDADSIAAYIENGGYWLFLNTLEPDTEFEQLYRNMGITSFDQQLETNGIHLMQNVLIGENNLDTGGDFIHNSSLSVALDDNTELLIESHDSVPLMWQVAYGEGNIMVVNGTMLTEKVNRGVIAGAIGMVEPVFIYPIFNSKVFFIDDFPAPVAKGRNPLIYKEYRQDLSGFYKNIWWPDMLSAAERYDITYTGVLIETYTDEVEAPFEFPADADRPNVIAYGREIIRSGGELGLHGYNHQSLTSDQSLSNQFEYNAWKSAKEMGQSIQEAITYTKSAFPNYTLTSYVPPSNVLSKEGRSVLKKVWPELTVISSLYAEDATKAAYVQEFEVAKDNVIEMPRISSGYEEREFDRWAEANAITSIGVYSKFIHPDDVISQDRSNNRTWEETYALFKKDLKRVSTTYPWLRPFTSTEASLELASALSSEISLNVEDDRVTGTVQKTLEELYFMLRTDKKITSTNNCDVDKIDEKAYLVKVGSTDFEIMLGGH
ncbi:DUF2194 domain-containing protein [Sporosarcina sp. A2]|uniref:DUF2194 domain-containing protein n=1 Tax=Sporosarcina sp. A2 TaxID=3393449 RepID=UPI003D7AEC32